MGRYIYGDFEYKFAFAEQPSDFAFVFEQVFGQEDSVSAQNVPSTYTTEDDDGNEIEEVSDQSEGFTFEFGEPDRAIEILIDWLGPEYIKQWTDDESFDRLVEQRWGNAPPGSQERADKVYEFWSKYMMWNFLLYMIRELKGQPAKEQFIEIEY